MIESLTMIIIRKINKNKIYQLFLYLHYFILPINYLHLQQIVKRLLNQKEIEKLIYIPYLTID